MTRRIKDFIRYTLAELENYTKHKGSCIKKINKILHINFPPYGLSTFKTTLLKVISDRKIGLYDNDLQGIILDIRNIKVLGKQGAIRFDDPSIHINIQADCYVFQPSIGSIVHGIVKHISQKQIGVIIYRVFSVPIRLSEFVKKASLTLNSEIEFRIKSFDLQNTMPYIEGELYAKEITSMQDKNIIKFDCEDSEDANSDNDSVEEEQVFKPPRRKSKAKTFCEILAENENANILKQSEALIIKSETTPLKSILKKEVKFDSSSENSFGDSNKQKKKTSKTIFSLDSKIDATVQKKFVKIESNSFVNNDIKLEKFSNSESDFESDKEVKTNMKLKNLSQESIKSPLKKKSKLSSIKTNIKLENLSEESLKSPLKISMNSSSDSSSDSEKKEIPKKSPQKKKNPSKTDIKITPIRGNIFNKFSSTLQNSPDIEKHIKAEQETTVATNGYDSEDLFYTQTNTDLEIPPNQLKKNIIDQTSVKKKNKKNQDNSLTSAVKIMEESIIKKRKAKIVQNNLSEGSVEKTASDSSFSNAFKEILEKTKAEKLNKNKPSKENANLTSKNGVKEILQSTLKEKLNYIDGLDLIINLDDQEKPKKKNSSKKRKLSESMNETLTETLVENHLETTLNQSLNDTDGNIPNNNSEVKSPKKRKSNLKDSTSEVAAKVRKTKKEKIPITDIF